MNTANIIETIGQTEAVVRMTTTDKLVMADRIMTEVVIIITIEKITTIEKMMIDTLQEVGRIVESSRFTLAPICGTLTTSIKEYLMLLKRTNQRK
jgi:hypothetical protein